MCVQQLRGERTTRALSIRKTRVLQHTTPDQLFETVGVDGSDFIEDLSDVLTRMLRNRSMNAGFPISHFDLFAHGLTNIARPIYYGMDIAHTIAEYKLAASNSEFDVGIGEPEHKFMFAFVQFLIAQNLARIEFADCLIDWTDREMQPHFVAPLTSRGRSLVALIHQIEKEMVDSGALPDAGFIHVAQEAFFSMCRAFITRLPRIQAFQRALSEAAKRPAS